MDSAEIQRRIRVAVAALPTMKPPRVATVCYVDRRDVGQALAEVALFFGVTMQDPVTVTVNGRTLRADVGDEIPTAAGWVVDIQLWEVGA